MNAEEPAAPVGPDPVCDRDSTTHDPEFTAPDDEFACRDDEFARRLYLTHRLALLDHVRHMLPGDPARAEDIVQETLLRAWLAAPREDHREPRAIPSRLWLLRVARNLVIDHVRRERIRPRLQRVPRPDSAPDPGDDIGRALERLVLVQSLARLSPQHREVLVYVYLLGCTGPDAANTLGIPPGTVKSRVHHAMRQLRAGIGAPAAGA